MRSSFLKRARILSGLFILGAVVILVRLYFLQIVHGQAYKSQAIQQYVETSPESLERGSIFFTSKEGEEVAAAVMRSGWRVTINPSVMSNQGAIYSKLNAIVPIDREQFDKSAAKRNDTYEEVAKRLTDDQARAVRALKLKGVSTVEDRWRTYPGKDLAAHVLGFVGFRGDTRAGRYGIEREYEATLTRTDSGLYINPFAQLFTNARSLITSDPAAEQGDVIISIEPMAQRELEKVLDKVVAKYSPKVTGGIVMDPKTGKVIAMGARPDFDPNTFNTETSAAVFSNPMVESVFEMGSIMKPLTMAAGLDANVITPNTTYNDTGCIDKSGKKVCNFDFKARGVVPMQEILSQSLNVGASFVAEQIGQKRFSEYLNKLGLGRKTEIDLPNEATGILNSLNADIDLASASFGQGFAVTPIEMTRALAVLANEGKLSSPHIATYIKLESGISRSVSPIASVHVYSPEAVEETTAMLVRVFDKALLKGELKQPHYSIAAKTGTAQIAKPGGGGYYDDRYLHSFFGYFPAHDPKFIVFLFAVEPHGVEYASASLAHPFLDIAKFLINYYDIPPDR